MKKYVAVLTYIFAAGLSFSRAEEITSPLFDPRVNIPKIKAVEVLARTPGSPAAAVLSLRAVEFTPEIWALKNAKDLKTKKAAVTREPVNLNCDSLPGSKLCWQLATVDDTLQPCDGAYCTALWKKGSSLLDEISSSYAGMEVKSVGKDIGQAANRVANSICNIQLFTFGSAYNQMALTDFALSMNIAMKALVDIQTRAGLESIEKCTMVVS